MKIRNKLILCFLFVVLIPTFIIAMVIFVGSRNIINEQLNELTEKNLQSIKQVIQQRLDFMGEMAILISTNPLIRDVLSSDRSNDIATNVSRMVTMDRALDSYFLSNTFSANSLPMVPRIYLINRPELLQYNISTCMYDISELRDAGWYQKMYNVYMHFSFDYDEQKVKIARKLYDLRNVDIPQYAALLTITIDSAYFNNLLHSYKSFPGSRIYILDENNRLILSSDPADSDELRFLDSFTAGGSAPFRHNIMNKSVIIASELLSGLNWRLIHVTDLDSINSDENILTRIVIGVLVVSTLISVSTSLLFSNIFSRPIVSLVNSMRTVGDNNFIIDIDYQSNDEFGYLIDQYKKMIRQIQDLIDKLYVSQMNKQKVEIDIKNAQLMALQAQINPHFLYNTLDSINLYAIKYKVPAICEMIDSLANFFRYTLSAGSALITLEEEIIHTRNYLKLESVRMGDDLRYHFNIPGDLRGIRIVKLVLQPLVENSIRHGFINKKPPLEIEISAWREEANVIIRISDNGGGADADLQAIGEMLNNKEDSLFFAINNVHKRLQNVFGENYGLSYRPGESGGLTAFIILPAANKYAEPEVPHD
jgi:two-component system sensor histidine kinase YesM